MKPQAAASGSPTFIKFLPQLQCKKSSAGPTCLQKGQCRTQLPWHHSVPCRAGIPPQLHNSQTGSVVPARCWNDTAADWAVLCLLPEGNEEKCLSLSLSGAQNWVAPLSVPAQGQAQAGLQHSAFGSWPSWVGTQQLWEPTAILGQGWCLCTVWSAAAANSLQLALLSPRRGRHLGAPVQLKITGLDNLALWFMTAQTLVIT